MTVAGMVKDEELAELIGDVIACGSARIVYKMRDDDRWVIKKGRAAPYASNKKEWEIWKEIAGSAIAPLFGKCQAVSNSYQYLVMEYLNDLDATDTARVPAMPAWLTDRKRSALGKAPNGDIKVLDYAQVRDCADRINAPKQAWPSEGETSSMRDLMARLNSTGNEGE